MRTAVILALALAQAFAAPNFARIAVNSILEKERVGPESHYIVKFADYVAKYEKQYATEAEVVNRFDYFVQNLRKIDALNKEAKGMTTFAINHFTDMPWEEFKEKHLVNGRPPVSLKALQTLPVSNRTINLNHPDNWDWRVSGIVGPIKNQGGCGACWAFATAAVAESMAAKEGKGLKSFAEQQLVDCVDGGCSGGVIQHSFGYGKDHGFPLESDYPYKAAKGTCHNANVVYKFGSMTQLSSDEEQMAGSVTDGGPFAIAFKVGNAFQHYGGGILTNTDCNNENSWHAIAIIGYGIENGHKFWIGKNQWGTGWGESGYFRATRGSNWCNVAFSPVAAW